MTHVIVNIGTIPGSSERPNEDWAGATTNAVVILDGVTAPATNGHGCHHSVQWFVRSLGTWFLMLLETGDVDMVTALGDAIDQVADLHRDSCDLSHPGTPAAAAAAFRRVDDKLEWLVLADTTVVMDTSHGFRVITDTRVDQAAPDARERVLKQRIGSPGQKAALSHMTREQLKRRNVPGGYWVAAADRKASHEAVTGSISADMVRRATLFTDGAWTTPDDESPKLWKNYLDGLWLNGIEMSLYEIRRMENRDHEGVRWPRYKKSDDATIALIDVELSNARVAAHLKEPTVSGESGR